MEGAHPGRKEGEQEKGPNSTPRSLPYLEIWEMKESLHFKLSMRTHRGTANSGVGCQGEGGGQLCQMLQLGHGRGFGTGKIVDSSFGGEHGGWKLDGNGSKIRERFAWVALWLSVCFQLRV